MAYRASVTEAIPYTLIGFLCGQIRDFYERPKRLKQIFFRQKNGNIIKNYAKIMQKLCKSYTTDER
jgi:hypothetical protein